MLLNLTDKIDLQRGEKSVALSNGWKNKKIQITTRNVEHQLQLEIIN